MTLLTGCAKTQIIMHINEAKWQSPKIGQQFFILFCMQNTVSYLLFVRTLYFSLIFTNLIAHKFNIPGKYLHMTYIEFMRKHNSLQIQISTNKFLITKTWNKEHTKMKWFTVSNRAFIVMILSINEPHHEKTCLCHMRTTKVQISLPSHAVWSASLFLLPG